MLTKVLLFCSAMLASVVITYAEQSIYAVGKRLVEAKCTQCHAIREAGYSPFAAAPPFREVAKNYTQEELVDGFMEGLAVRHQAMPDWDMTTSQAEAIATFIMALNRTGAKTDDSPAAVGYEIMLKSCARCHAIGTDGDSPLAKAPPFREVMQRYDPVNLEEALAEGIVTGHDQMPEFVFDPDQIASIVAYLSTLRSE